MKAPYVPVLKSKADTGNFDVEFTSCPVESYEESPSDATKGKFEGFSYEWSIILQRLWVLKSRLFF